MILLGILILIHIPFYAYFAYPRKVISTHTYTQMIILGCPCLPDGTLSGAQLRRIQAATQYYQKHQISTIIITGGSVKNKYTEAQVMADEVQKRLPEAHIKVETMAKNTYQNMKYVASLYPSDNVLIVSGSSHLRRSYFFARKFYLHISMGYGTQRDPWYFYLWEYTRMWNALYWEIILHFKK